MGLTHIRAHDLPPLSFYAAPSNDMYGMYDDGQDPQSLRPRLLAEKDYVLQEKDSQRGTKGVGNTNKNATR